MAHAMMLIDTSRCIGCRSCQVACQQWHSKTAEDTQFTGSYQNPPDKSGANFTVVKFSEYEVGSEVRWLFFPDRCRHCLYPHCMYACPLSPPKGIHQFEWGGVAVNEARCNTALCNKECQTACPFKSDGVTPLGIPRFEYIKDGTPVSLTTAQKCDFCYDRFGNPELNGASDPPSAQDGGRFRGAHASFYGFPPYSNRPACEVACPTGALRCAWHTDVIPYAFSRANALKANGYPNANVYPPPPVQTHMLWVLTEPPSAYGL